jgi:HTH-type transcriptional regulator/antitoxin HigA
MVKPIKTEKQYEEALKRIALLLQKNVKENSSEYDELEALSIFVKVYEEEHYPIPKPNPIEAIKFRMEQLGLSEAELSTLLGNRSRKSEILSGKRKLSLSMIRKLNEVLNIPAEVLIQAY